MSTYAYAALTDKRLKATAGTSSANAPPGVQTFVDALAALVPAEVLVAHGVILGYVTTTDSKVTPPVTTITNPTALQIGFWGLLVLAIAIYVGVRLVNSTCPWTRWDFIRMTIPALAFVAWTMIQKTTAFDVVLPSLDAGVRGVVAVLAAIALGLVAGWLGYKADKAPPCTPAPPGG